MSQKSDTEIVVRTAREIHSLRDASALLGEREEPHCARWAARRGHLPEVNVALYSATIWMRSRVHYFISISTTSLFATLMRKRTRPQREGSVRSADDKGMNSDAHSRGASRWVGASLNDQFRYIV
jgi:hypothetical protein